MGGFTRPGIASGECEIRTNCCIEETQSGPADHNPRDPNPAFAQHTPSGHRLMGSKIHDDVHSRLAFERKFCCVPTDALVGDFGEAPHLQASKRRQDLNDVGQALLEHRYQHATQLTLDFQSCSHLSDVSALGTGLASFTALQELTLVFKSCDDLSDVSAVGTGLASLTERPALQELRLVFGYCPQLSDVSALGTGLAALTSLQRLTLDFQSCPQLSDVSAVGTALASLTALQKLCLDFKYCRELPEAIRKRFFSRDEFLKEISSTNVAQEATDAAQTANENHSTARHLLSHGPALYDLAMRGEEQEVRALLSEAAPDCVQYVDQESGDSALHAASRHGHLGVVRVLLGASAVVDQPNNQGFTPLFLAAQHGHLEVVRVLLGASAVVDQPDNKGATALIAAAQGGKLEVVRELLGASAVVDQQENQLGMTALYIAAQNGELEVVRVLLGASAVVDRPSNAGATALNIAAEKAHLEVVKELLGASAVVDQPNNQGITALLMASQLGQLEVVQLLADSKADLDKANNKGVTPVGIAASKGMVDAVQLLVVLGAAVNPPADDWGDTPLSEAKAAGHSAIVEILEAAGAR